MSYSERTDKQEKIYRSGNQRFTMNQIIKTEKEFLEEGEAYSFQEKSSNLDMNMVFSYNQQLVVSHF